MRDYLQLHPTDNLIVALRDLPAGQTLACAGRHVTLEATVPAKHKFTLGPVAAGDELTMYGVPIGRALTGLPAGSRITTTNIVHAAARYTRAGARPSWMPPDFSRWQNRTFLGYPRTDGSSGTANYWLIIPLVFCENRNVEVLRDSLLEPLGYATRRPSRYDITPLVQAIRGGGDAGAVLSAPMQPVGASGANKRVFPHVDGIKFLTHEGGCGGTREDAATLCNLLAGYLCNPNVGGATVLSLGCQNAQIQILRTAIARIDPDFAKPLRILEQQGGGSERAFVERAIRQTFTGLMEANQVRRQPTPLSQLTLGLECGGSDGFSGISANPALGHVSDLLVALGGRAILAEFPELNGVEQELIDRCKEEP